VKELKSETSGNFKTVLEALCLSAAEFDASQLKKAMKVGDGYFDCLLNCVHVNRVSGLMKTAS
jgi:hypothetical protein